MVVHPHPLLPPVMLLVVTLASAGCSPSPPPQAPPPPSASRALLDVQARHSEDAELGGLAGLLVAVENRSTQPVRGIRITISASYFSGLELRRFDPPPLRTELGPAAYTFEFTGPRPGVRFGYLIVLTPRQEGEYPAEVTVLMVGPDEREELLAIYDITTRVRPPQVAH